MSVNGKRWFSSAEDENNISGLRSHAGQADKGSPSLFKWQRVNKLEGPTKLFQDHARKLFYDFRLVSVQASNSYGRLNLLHPRASQTLWSNRKPSREISKRSLRVLVGSCLGEHSYNQRLKRVSGYLGPLRSRKTASQHAKNLSRPSSSHVPSTTFFRTLKVKRARL